MRAVLLATLAGVLVAGCQFDTTGAGGAPGDDDGAVDPIDATPAVDAPGLDAPPPDAPVIIADASPPDAGNELLTCVAEADCPGQSCCVYGLGIGSACVDDCVGGEVTCDGPSDCDDPFMPECCPIGAGVSVCRLFCL